MYISPFKKAFIKYFLELVSCNRFHKFTFSHANIHHMPWVLWDFWVMSRARRLITETRKHRVLGFNVVHKLPRVGTASCLFIITPPLVARAAATPSTTDRQIRTRRRLIDRRLCRPSSAVTISWRLQDRNLFLISFLIRCGRYRAGSLS